MSTTAQNEAVKSEATKQAEAAAKASDRKPDTPAVPPIENRRVSTTNNNLPMMLTDIESKKTPVESVKCMLDHLNTLAEPAFKEARHRGASDEQLRPVEELFELLRSKAEAFAHAVEAKGPQP